MKLFRKITFVRICAVQEGANIDEDKQEGFTTFPIALKQSSDWTKEKTRSKAV